MYIVTNIFRRNPIFLINMNTIGYYLIIKNKILNILTTVDKINAFFGFYIRMFHITCLSKKVKNVMSSVQNGQFVIIIWIVHWNIINCIGHFIIVRRLIIIPGTFSFRQISSWLASMVLIFTSLLLISRSTIQRINSISPPLIINIFNIIEFTNILKIIWMTVVQGIKILRFTIGVKFGLDSWSILWIFSNIKISLSVFSVLFYLYINNLPGMV